MAGTKQGSLKRRNRLMESLGGRKAYIEHMRQIGSRGGAASGTGGFYANRDLARTAGRIGGQAGKGKPKRRTRKETV